MVKKLKNLDPIVHVFFLIAIIVLFSGHFFLDRRVGKISISLEKVKSQVLDKGGLKVSGDGLSLSQVDNLIATAIATISGVPRAVVQKISLQKQVTYIPMGDEASTTETDWMDIEGTQISIDAAADYGQGAQISWEASLKVANGNGQAFARLWDDTNKIAVVGSEISTTSNSDFVHQSTGDLIFWNGRNLYKIQIKSLNGFEVTYSNGRIKIRY